MVSKPGDLGYWKFLGGGGLLEAKFFEAVRETKLEFPGGRRGAKRKTFHVGDYGYFLELHICELDGDIHLNKYSEFCNHQRARNK